MLNNTNLKGLKKGIKMFRTIKTVASVVSVGLTVKSGYDIYKKGKNIYDVFNFTRKANSLLKKKNNTIKDKVKKILSEK